MKYIYIKTYNKMVYHLMVYRQTHQKHTGLGGALNGMPNTKTAWTLLRAMSNILHM